MPLKIRANPNVIFVFCSRCASSPAASSSSSGGLVIGYYLCDDPVPYRSQWPSNVITLGQFKHLVPKKGLFRWVYFFEFRFL